MLFSVYNNGDYVTQIEADTEDDVKDKLIHAGFRNKSKKLEIIKND